MLLTVRDASLFLSVKPSWIYRQVKAGRIPCHTLPNSKGTARIIRFVQSELEDWVKNNGKGAENEL